MVDNTYSVIFIFIAMTIVIASFSLRNFIFPILTNLIGFKRILLYLLTVIDKNRMKMDSPIFRKLPLGNILLMPC